MFVWTRDTLLTTRQQEPIRIFGDANQINRRALYIEKIRVKRVILNYDVAEFYLEYLLTEKTDASLLPEFFFNFRLKNKANQSWKKDLQRHSAGHGELMTRFDDFWVKCCCFEVDNIGNFTKKPWNSQNRVSRTPISAKWRGDFSFILH